MSTNQNAAIADSGKVRLGAGFRNLATAPAVAPAPVVQVTPAAVADAGKVRLGAGFRRV